jgi:hypothetical protein
VIHASLRSRVRRLEQAVQQPKAFGFVLYPSDWPDGRCAMTPEQRASARRRIEQLKGLGHCVYVADLARSEP